MEDDSEVEQECDRSEAAGGDLGPEPVGAVVELAVDTAGHANEFGDLGGERGGALVEPGAELLGVRDLVFRPGWGL